MRVTSPIKKLIVRGVLVAFLVSGASMVMPSGALSQSAQDVTSRLNQLDNQIQTLSRYVYRGNDGGLAPVPETLGGGQADSSPVMAGAFEDRFAELEERMRYLTGEIEKSQFENRELKQKVESLEKQVADMTSKMQSAPQPQNQQPFTDTEQPVQNTSADQSTNSQPRQPNVVVDPNNPDAAAHGSGYPLPVGDAAGAYEMAFSHIKEQQYDQASSAFTAFIKQYPNSDLIPNARYWLGESFYVRGTFDKAAMAFAEAYQKDPEGNKAPDNLLKLGMSLGEMGKKQDACLSFSELRKQFPAAPNAIMTRLGQQEKRFSCN